jgi:hypothetical protein
VVAAEVETTLREAARLLGLEDLRVTGRGRLYGTMILRGAPGGGYSLHADLYRVRWVGLMGEHSPHATLDCFSQVFDCEGADDAEQHYAAAGGDGPWQTVTIRGVEYAVVLTPYCD